ncbi:MAG: PRC-barrel domain-containing protein, partial [Synechococcaceae cyanobacterium]|nr:PRC-barrel domain-containing protein [Synechococcaceae cyanobacterium]
LGLRDNPLTRFLPGLPRWMPLDRIRQVGDVILVDSADSLAEGFDPERYSKVINCQVVSESGVQLGRVLGFSFDIETGELTTLVIGALGVPLLGEGVLSTWELPVAEIVSSGTDRIVVYEGAEDKLRQLGTGLLEKLGIGGNSWEQEERDRFRSTMVPAENQLPAGTATAQEQRRLQPASSRAFEPRAEMEYVELEERVEREPLRQRRYLEEDQPERGGRGDWSERESEWQPQRQRGDAWEDRQGGRRAGDSTGDRGREWRDDRGGDEGRRQEWEPRQDRWTEEPEISRGVRQREPEREASGPAASRDWVERSGRRQDEAGDGPDSFGAGAEGDPRRRPSGLERGPGPDSGRRPLELNRDEAWRADRSQPRAPGQPAARPAEEPVDVEPEVLDDPW